MWGKLAMPRILFVEEASDIDIDIVPLIML